MSREHFEWWGVVDAGLVFNRETGRKIWKPGEIIQAHKMIGNVEVWAEWNTAEDAFQLAVGSNPKYCPMALDREGFCDILGALLSRHPLDVPQLVFGEEVTEVIVVD